MNQKPHDEEDTMRAEYDLKTLRIRRVGAKRKQFGGVSLEPEISIASVSDNEASDKECEATKNGFAVQTVPRSVTPKVS